MVIHYYSTHEMYIVSMSFVYLAGLVTGLRRMVTASTWGEGRTEPGVLGVDPPPYLGRGLNPALHRGVVPLHRLHQRVARRHACAGHRG